MSRGSIGGVTIGNGWMRNNPDLLYPDGHEQMDDKTLLRELKAKPLDYELEKPRKRLKKNKQSK